MRICAKTVNIILPIFLLFAISVQSNDAYCYDDLNGNDGLTALSEMQKSEISLLATSVVSMDRTRTLDSIVQKAKELPHSGFDGGQTRFVESPQYTAPYKAGSLNPDDIADAVNAVKMVRYVAGLPYETISFPSELNNISQHGAVLMAASAQFTHTPTQPDDMDDEFFELGYKGCSEANIYSGINNLSKAVLGFIGDSGSGNIETAGHRIGSCSLVQKPLAWAMLKTVQAVKYLCMLPQDRDLSSVNRIAMLHGLIREIFPFSIS